jgi:hypothetical protein
MQNSSLLNIYIPFTTYMWWCYESLTRLSQSLTKLNRAQNNIKYRTVMRNYFIITI